MVLSSGIYFHKIINFALLFLVILNLGATLLFSKNFIFIHKVIWFTTPLLFGILAIMLISGFSLMAMTHFNFSLIVFYMFFINILIIILEVKRIKHMKLLLKKLDFNAFNSSEVKPYIRYTTSLYVLYIVLILVCNFRF